MRYLITALLGVTLFSLFLSCQKELSLEFGGAATGSLQNAAGDCLPKQVTGAYVAGKATNDSNYLEVTVNVASPGPYTITTDTVNGYAFKATGTFTTTGTNTVRLKASGTPTSAGVNTFAVAFDTSLCFVAVTVLPSGSTGGPATFTLQGAPNACGSFTVGATPFYKDTVLDSRHTVTFNVNVTAVGTYTITTSPVNGYQFSKTGTFGGTGITPVTLVATGKPLATGTDNFTVTAGSSTCTFAITVTTPGPTPPPTGCNPNVQGTFTAGTATTTANKVTLTHTYATAGTYTVTTGSLNGYQFATATTTITATAGANTIVLTATGTPTNAGTDNFTVNFGDGQSCSFPVTVNPATSTVNTDYFPLSANSYWTYDDAFTAGDTLKRVNNATATDPNTGIVYRDFEEFDNTGASAFDYYFRRNGNDYLEYTIGDAYSITSFDNFVEGEILFLKEGLTTNATWFSAEFSDSVNSVPTKIRYAFTCVDANGTATVNGKSFTNVYKIKMQPQVSTNGGAYANDPLTVDAYFAKGIGLIYRKYAASGFGTAEEKIRYWKVF